MHFLAQTWQWTSLVAALLACVGVLVWLLQHRKPTAEELERERRLRLVSFGRLVDGLLVDQAEVPVQNGSTRILLLYQYEIAGVHYECAQDITALHDELHAGQIPVGLPCSVRYQPGSPENSIVLAETWSGLRTHGAPRALRPESPFLRSHLAHPRPTRAIG